MCQSQERNENIKNSELIRSAFLSGFREGIAFLNESNSSNASSWRQKAFKSFCKKHNIKI